MTSKAVVLFSGGLDSTTCLAVAKQTHDQVYAISFNYGQRHVQELEHAKKIARSYEVVEHQIVNLPTEIFQGSALTDDAIEVPHYQQHQSAMIPTTYVPARNTLFLSFALAFAESIAAGHIYIGVSAIDYSGYPDCRPEFIAAFQSMANLATKSATTQQPTIIAAPLLHLTKAETIQLGNSLGVNYQATVSCYQANASGQACGRCDSCCLRRQGFEEAGIADPTNYVKS